MVITLQYMHLSRLFIYIKQCFVSIISIKLGGKNEEKRPENSLFEMQTSQSRALISQSLGSVEAQMCSF